MSPLDDEEPMTLEEACKVIFRNAIKPATLRVEAERGRLVIERIGRRDFVTRRAIREMRRLCQLAPSQKVQDSGSNPSASGRAAGPRQPLGSSETTEDSNNAFRSALKIAHALKKPSKTTSRKSTASHPVNVVPLRG